MAVINHHKFDGLEQQKFILSQTWRPEISNKGIGRVVLSLEALGEILLILCQTLGSPAVPWLVAASFPSLPPFSLLVFSLLEAHFSLHLGPAYIIQDDLILGFFFKFHLQRPFFQVRSQSHTLVARTWTYLVGGPPVNPLH